MGHIDLNVTGTFNGTNGIVDQIYECLLHLLAIDIERRDIAGVVNFKIDPCMAVPIQRQGFFNNRQQITGHWICAWKPGKGRKFIHQIANQFHLADNRLGALFKNRIIHKLCVFSLQTLGGKSDGGEWIFYLMSDSTGDFTPGGHALAFFQFG